MLNDVDVDIEKKGVGDPAINGEVCPFMYMIWSGSLRQVSHTTPNHTPTQQLLLELVFRD